MWGQLAFSGFPLPFILLGFCFFGSLICAKFISHDSENLGCNVNAQSDSPENVIILTRSRPSVTAFINHSSNRVVESILSRHFLSKKSSNYINTNNSNDGETLKERKLSTSKDPLISSHYTCPPTSLEELRRRYGTADFWGDWSPAETRRFYKQMLPKALAIDGALGLTLKQRAEIASANRHALKLYARERCHLPARIIARVYDGLRHLYNFGTWKSDGMSWSEVKRKYSAEAKAAGCETKEEILLFVYTRIIERSSATNPLFDEMAESETVTSNQMIVYLLLKNMFETSKTNIQQTANAAAAATQSAAIATQSAALSSTSNLQQKAYAAALATQSAAIATFSATAAATAAMRVKSTSSITTTEGTHLSDVPSEQSPHISSLLSPTPPHSLSPPSPSPSSSLLSPSTPSESTSSLLSPSPLQSSPQSSSSASSSTTQSSSSSSSASSSTTQSSTSLFITTNTNDNNNNFNFNNSNNNSAYFDFNYDSSSSSSSSSTSASFSASSSFQSSILKLGSETMKTLSSVMPKLFPLQCTLLILQHA